MGHQRCREHVLSGATDRQLCYPQTQFSVIHLYCFFFIFSTCREPLRPYKRCQCITLNLNLVTTCDLRSGVKSQNWKISNGRQFRIADRRILSEDWLFSVFTCWNSFTHSKMGRSKNQPIQTLAKSHIGHPVWDFICYKCKKMNN